MAAVYTRTNLQDAIWDPLIDANISSVVTVANLMNETVREVLARIDLRSTKRRAATSPNLFDEVYDYAKPSDMKRFGLVDLIPQIGRGKDDEWTLTTSEEFDRMKASKTLVVAVIDHDLAGRLRVSVDNDADSLTIASLDSLTGDGGTWVAFSTDSDTVEVDTDNFVKGSGSVRWNITAVGGTTAGIKNTSLSSFDYDDYVTLNRSVFIWAYVTSATNLTNYILRVGSSETAYDSMTATTQNDGTAFRAGWNLLRFDFSGKTTTGSPTRTAGTYGAIYMTKAAGKVSETGYRFDHVIAQEGKYYDVSYYSKYGWQSTSGTWIENSTAATDLLNADTEEFDLFAQYGRVKKAKLERDWNLADREMNLFKDMEAKYKLEYPSEAMLLVTSYREI